MSLMKKILLVLVIWIVLPGPTLIQLLPDTLYDYLGSFFHEWTKIVDRKDEPLFVYVDLNDLNINNDKNKVKMSSIRDYKIVQINSSGTRFLSQMFLEEYDCKEKTSRVITLFEYSGNYRHGEIVFSQRDMKSISTSITSKSVDELLFEIACENNTNITENIIN